MTIENKESILRRIQKLLAIAGDDRADPNEAAAAAGMAERIMRKYQFEHADLILASLSAGNDLDTVDVVASAKTNGTQVKQVPPWAGWIAVAVSKFTECSASVATNPDGEKCVRFYGFTEDVKLAGWTFNYLVATTNRLVNAFKLTPDYATGGRVTLNSYRQGVATGILTALNALTHAKKEEMRSSSTSNALMVAKESAITAAFGAHPTRRAKTGVTQRTGAFAAGVRDGKAVDLGRRAVNAPTSTTLRIG